MNSLIDRESKVIFQTYKRLPIVVDHAEGCRIYDKDGNCYLDFLAGIAVNALGYSHPKVIEALRTQGEKFMHLSNYFYQEPQIRLAEKITSMSPFSRVFFSNSGTEAVEGAIKLVRRWGYEKDKTEIVSFTGGFHGRTYGALSMMDKPLYKDQMGPFLPNMKIAKYNNVDDLKKSVSDKTTAVILEFVQGEGGVTAARKEFVDEIFYLKDKFNFLVIADEIQTGIGRTGKMFAFENYGVKPDVATCAKGIGGGLPLGAILAKESLADVWEKGMHGTTYGGNAVACATGLAVLNELDNGVMKNVNVVGSYLHVKLEELKETFPKLVLEVRGLGLMKGLSLSFDATILVKKLLERHIITNATSGTVLRLVPPLIITKSDVDELIDNIRECLGEM